MSKMKKKCCCLTKQDLGKESLHHSNAAAHIFVDVCGLFCSVHTRVLMWLYRARAAASSQLHGAWQPPTPTYTGWSCRERREGEMGLVHLLHKSTHTCWYDCMQQHQFMSPRTVFCSTGFRRKKTMRKCSGKVQLQHERVHKPFIEYL